MAYDRVNWQSGTKVSDGYVEIDGTQHTVTPAVYSGSTPVNPTTLNIMDAGIKQNSDDIAQNASDIQQNSNNIQSISKKINGEASISKIYVGEIECKNFWPLEDEIRVIKSTAFQTNLPVGTYTISGYITGDDAVSSAIKFYDDNENLITTVLLEHNIQNVHQTFNLSSACTLVRVYSNETAEASTNKTSIFEDMQLEPGNTMTDYVEHRIMIPNVVNSLDTDSSENVPSVHAVNSKFAVLTGTISISNGYTAQDQVDYPTGFNKNNCVVISQMLNNMGGANYSSGYNGSISQQPLISLGDQVAVRLAFDAVTTASFDYKVVLMKI